jgi:hypothetical protein
MPAVNLMTLTLSSITTLRTISDHCTRPIDLDYPQEDQDLDLTDHRPYLRGRVPLETHILDFDHKLCPGPVPLWFGHFAYSNSMTLIY